MIWDGDHGDEAVYVVSGSLAVDGRACAAGGTVIVESGASAAVQVTTDAEIRHFGPRSPAAPAEGAFGTPEVDGHGCHVVDAGGIYVRHAAGHPLESRVYADSACRTCRINLFQVSGPDGYRTPSHVHSEDEIICVLRGELQIGRSTVGPGQAVAVPGSYRYGFRAHGDFAFLNYRRDVSWATVAPGTPPVLEAARSPGEPVPVGT
jgi:uncharacterized cupin superfamily protein